MRTIVGREGELDAIGSFLTGGDGRPRVLRLEGEAGIGKTTLWEAATATASERGFRVLAARPLEVETRISFAAIADLLAGVLDEVAAELPDPQLRALEVALLLRDPDGPPPGPQAIAFAFLSVLRALARVTPTLVAVDDLQWLDQPTAVILAYAARRVGDEPIRFLFATRADGSPEAVDKAIDGTQSEALRLAPLSPGALQRMFHEMFGDGLPRPLLHRVHSTSGGNPFYALELGRALAQQSNRLKPGQPLPVLKSLSSLVDQRLGSLPDATARALRIAALSTEPTVALLEAAMDVPVDLSPAVAANVVTVEHGRVAFSHSLLSAAIAAKLSGPARMDIHHRLGELSTDPEGRAHHLALSASEPDAGIAAELEWAAGAARARGSPVASAELLEHALRLSPPGDDGVVRRTLDAADAHFETGDTDRALALLEALCEDLPPGGERAEVLYRHASVRAELELDLSAAIALYDRALAEPGLEPRLAARIHGDLAWLAVFVSDLSHGLRDADLAVAFAERSDSQVARAEALTARSFVQAVAGEPWAEGVLDRALALEDAGERFRIDRCPSLVAGVSLLWSGELEAARERFETVRKRALARGDETSVSLVEYHLAQIALQSGEIEHAAERVREAVLLAGQTGVNTAELGMLQAQVDALRGDIEAAVAAATAVLAVADRARDPMNALRALALLGFVALSRGRASEAHGHLRRAHEICRQAEVGEPAVLRFVPDAVEVLLSLDRPAEAEAVLAGFEASARRLGHAWALASVDRCRGLIRAATGDVPNGLTDLRRARDAQAQLPFPFDLARTLLALGTVERRALQRREARASLAAALELFERLAAPLWAERTRAELDRIGGRAPSRNALTPHEHRIAVLVSAGSTNREVAAALVVSVHTIEAALTRIYAKFQVRSRTELAARLAEQPSKL
jgi:DNA-binding CsgD family transcriptional regulator